LARITLSRGAPDAVGAERRRFHDMSRQTASGKSRQTASGKSHAPGGLGAVRSWLAHE
jgi:hypothetical protein